MESGAGSLVSHIYHLNYNVFPFLKLETSDCIKVSSLASLNDATMPGSYIWVFSP